MAWAAVGAFAGNVVGSILAPKPDNSAGQAAQASTAISQDQWNYYKKNYQPLESNLINQAQQAGSPEEYAKAAGRATADVAGGFDAGNKATESRMQSYGINPGSPAYASTVASGGLAQGSAEAGALTTAYNTQKQLAYSKSLDVAGLGRNIPAQSAASNTSAASTMQYSKNSQFGQNSQNVQNVGYGLQPLVGAAKSYFSNSTDPLSSVPNNTGNTFSMPNPGISGSNPYGNTSTGIMSVPTGYAKGGEVLDAAAQPDGSYAVPGLEPLLAKKGIHPMHAKTASNIKGYKPKMITPHMRFAGGGGVGRQGLESAGPDQSNMGDPSQSNQVIQGPGTETSDSIPAQVDGQHQAALSSGEFVMNAEVPKLSGDEILAAINNAGLQKRGQSPVPPTPTPQSQTTPTNAGATAYADGGDVQKPTAQQAPIGSGMAKMAVDKIAAKQKYDNEVISAQEDGRTLPPFEQWLASNQTQSYRNGGKIRYASAGL